MHGPGTDAFPAALPVQQLLGERRDCADLNGLIP